MTRLPDPDRRAWLVVPNLWVAEAPGRPPLQPAGVVGATRSHRITHRRYREWALKQWALAPEQAPEFAVVVDRRVSDVVIRRALRPAFVFRSPVPERGVDDHPVVALERLIGVVLLAARHRRVVVVGGQPHTTTVALAVLVSACGSVEQAYGLYGERGADPLPLNWDRFLTNYLLRFEVPRMMTPREG